MARSVLMVLIVCVLCADGLEAVGQEAVPTTYASSRGYSIQPPLGWRAVSAQSKLPADLSERMADTGILLAKATRTDHFVSKPVEGEFLDNMGVQVRQPMTMSDNTLKDLKKMLVPNYVKIFGNFRLSKFVRRKFGAHDTIQIRGEYTLHGYTVVMDQAVIMTEKGSLIITCSMSKKRQRRVGPACEKAYASVEFQ